MFYNNTDCAFKILGAYLVERTNQEGIAYNRKHTALSYRITGNSTFFVDNNQLIAQNGSIVFIPKGVNYRHINKEEKVIIIHLESYGKEEDAIEIIENATEFEVFFQNILSICEERGNDMHNRSMAMLYKLFSQLQKAYDTTESSIPKIIHPGVHLIQKNFKDSELTVSQVASKCCVSEVFFRQLYRKYFNESPLQTITKLRFEYACTLLQSGYYTQKQVAELSGFSDVKYFRKAFKKHFGVTPLQYIHSSENYHFIPTK